MSKNALKILGMMVAASSIVPGWASVNKNSYPAALFTARNCETRRISIGGYLTTAYQWISVDDDLTGPENQFFGKHDNPDEFNNFYMKNIRLFIRAELCDNWSTFISIDFARRDGQVLTSSEPGGPIIATECNRPLPIFIDRAYIQKQWSNAKLRVGYQKVNFCAEESISDEYLKTVNRSVATIFFIKLGRRAVSGTYTPGVEAIELGGSRFAGRHPGLHLSGDTCDSSLHYDLSIVNGEQGVCRNSDEFNNQLSYFFCLSYESSPCNIDLSIGINAGYNPLGGNFISTKCNAMPNNDSKVWGLNPYLLANWNCFTMLIEILYGSVENAKLVDLKSDANPWGFNFIPSYIINDSWEFVGRISFLNTNGMGTSINNVLGSAPNDGAVFNNLGACRNTLISSEVQFEKVVALYLGINYYTVNQTVKATFGYEYAKFKNAFYGTIGDGTGAFNNQNAVVNAVRAQLQLSF